MNYRNSFPFSLMLLIFFFSYFVFILNISLLSSSQLEKCINSDPSKDLTCDSKIILTLTVQNAELENTDYIETTFDRISDKEGNEQRISSPIKIAFSKTPVKVIYPLTYFQDFNWWPKEVTKKLSSFKCKDGDNDSKPTCGWMYDGKKKIKDSQGFCCDCNIGNFHREFKRGSECSGLFSIRSSAHCLKYDTVWFSAYKVERFKIDYTIGINITNTYDNSTISYLELSPQNTISINEEKNILVKLIGDFIPTDLHPRDFSDKYLCMPTKPENHLFVKQGKYRWMLIDKIRFTLDGSECNKIGVGYSAFRHQTDRCDYEEGSCLKNQLSHLYDQDTTRLYYGQNVEYLLIYDRNYNYDFQDNGPSSRSFSYNLKGNINTMIVLEMDTSSIRFVENVSSGKITKLYVNSGFEAMSDDGYMEISIINEGFLTSTFKVSYECNKNLIPLSADEISLEPHQIKSFNKSLYTNSNKAEINQCLVTLKNSIGEGIDMKFIYFNTTEEIEFNRQDSENSDNVSVIYEKEKYLICEEICQLYFDFLCYYKQKCWKLLIKKAIIALGIIIFILIFLKFYTRFYFCFKCIFKILCCCCIFKTERHKNNSNDSKQINILSK